MINWTDIVHRRTDNISDRPRRILWQVFGREGSDVGDRLCGHLSSEYRAAVARRNPERAKLMTGPDWRLEEIDQTNPFWPYHVDGLLQMLRGNGGAGAFRADVRGARL